MNRKSASASVAAEICQSSPLRRKSFRNVTDLDFLSENDDEAERRQRRRQSESFSNASDKRMSLGGLADFTAAEVVAHYANCIKLATENKINHKNAFSLQLIDYMSAMLKKRDSTMNNFQVASCTLDASTKIYASRVDRVHMDVFKMAGGLGILSNRKKKSGGEGGGDSQEGEEECEGFQKRQRSARKHKRCIAKNEETLNMAIEEDYRLDPMFMYMKDKFADCQPGFVNLIGRFTVRDDNSELLMFPEEPFCLKQPTNQSVTTVPPIPDLSGKPLSSFFREIFLNENDVSLNYSSFLRPQQDTELDLNLEEELETAADAEHCDAPDDNLSDDDYSLGNETAPVACRQQLPSSNILDLRDHLSLKPQEYSYFNLDKLSLWAGPAHWRIFPLSKDKVPTQVKNAAEKREKKNLELKFEEVDDIKDMYIKSNQLRISKRTIEKNWLSKKVTNPHDEHYDEKNLTRLFLRKNVRIIGNALPSPEEDEERDENIPSYDYNNLNDSQNYCPAPLEVEEDPDTGMNADDDCNIIMKPADDIHSTDPANAGWKVVTPPPKVARIIIPYAAAEKLVDMKRLKNVTWQVLTSKEDDKENTTENSHSSEKNNAESKMLRSVMFSDMYHDVVQQLPAKMAKDMSAYLAFSALLHLANEKILTLKEHENYTDITITQDVV